jgi:ornithine cyclodeaminase
MTDVPYFDAATITATLPPANAVDAIAAALVSGFDPASDIARTIAGTTHGQILLMPAEVGPHAGVKVVTIAPDNPAQGLPRIQATYLLYDAATLSPIAVLDGTALTKLRTPAVSVAAIRPALGRVHEPLRVAVFGAGPQAVAHVDTLAAVVEHPLAAVTFAVRRPERVGAAAPGHGTVVRADSEHARDALAAAHVVICATTARTPLFPADAVAVGAIVIAVGSHEPVARELDSALLARAAVIVEDVATALREAGDVILAIDEGACTADDLIPMRTAITTPAQVPADRPVVFKSVGMSWQDLVIASAVVSRTSRTP